VTFYVLVFAVLLAAGFVVMATSSLFAWPVLRLMRSRKALARLQASPTATADLLFAIRILPLLLSLVATLGFALPAFVRLEPHAAGETISVKLWLLAAAGGLVLTAMAVRGARMLRATSRAEKIWRADSQVRLVDVAGEQARLYCVNSARPLLAVTGFFRPRIFVAREVLSVLSPGELRTAVAHEMVHVRRLDNFKQFLLRITQPPRWLGANRDFAWVEASEIAADAGALTCGASALDLAAALVKIAALKRVPAWGDGIAASHLLPDLPGSPLQARVQLLQKALESETVAQPFLTARRPWATIAFFAVLALTYASVVSTALPAVHEALEVLVR
jgi:Zn-dependent protease with chaperone function